MSYQIGQTISAKQIPAPLAPRPRSLARSRLQAVAHAEHELNELREKWLNSPDASEAELKKRTLTNLYNARPAWLAAAHATLNRAVWAAYGWDDDPSDASDDQATGFQPGAGEHPGQRLNGKQWRARQKADECLAR